MRRSLVDISNELLLVSNKDKHNRITLFTDWLTAKGIKYLTSNEGIHIRITHPDYTEINIWPTTCKMHMAEGAKRTPYSGWKEILTALDEMYD